jgi:hypothetical protein
VRAKERRLKRREHREQHGEEYRLCEQQGLPPPGTPMNSSSEEESDGGASPLLEVESPAPVATGYRGNRGTGTHGGRGGTRHRVISGGARERRGGTGGHHSGAPIPSRKRK